MSLQTLLLAYEGAGRQEVATKAKLVEAQAALAKATSAAGAAVDAALKDADKAATAKLASQQAIFDLLADKGEMVLKDPKGTVSIYRACEISETCPGWKVTQPADGA